MVVCGINGPILVYWIMSHVFTTIALVHINCQLFVCVVVKCLPV